MPPLVADADITIESLQADMRALAGEMKKLKGWRRQLESDDSFGRVMSGAQWIDGVSVVDGTVEGRKFTATVTVSSLFQTAESPADRWELDANGMRFYATVSAVANTKIFDINPVAGTLQFGSSGSNVISFAGGVLSVPAASISSLTIANVGTGQIGGTYRTSAAASGARMEMSTAGIKGYNSGGTQTFFLDASAGSFQMIGTFNIADSTSASDRLEFDQDGIELWKGGTREFYLASATNGIDMLLTGGSAGQYIGMNPSTGFWLGASSFASGPFRVTPAGVATMVGATIQTATSGARVEITSSGLIAYSGGSTQTVNISGSSSTITAGLFRTSSSNPRVEMDSTGIYQYNSGGTIVAKIATDGTGYVGASGSLSWSSTTVSMNADRLTSGTVGAGGSLALGTLSVSGTITIGSGGSIVDADGSSWTQSGITLVSGGVLGDTIIWKSSSTNTGYIWAVSGTTFEISAATTSQAVQIDKAGSSTDAIVLLGTAGDLNLQAKSGRTVFIGPESNQSYFDPALRAYGALYPGNSARQGNTYIKSAGDHMDIHLRDAAGTYQLRVFDSGAVQVFGIDSNGAMQLPGSDTSAAGTYYGRTPVTFNGLTKYIHLFNA